MILCIDTAINKCSVGLSWEGKSVGQLVHQDAFKASEVLHQLIQQLLSNHNFTLRSLKAIAINGGPGSYTGLRIGATTAKGLCYALNIPLIHIDGLLLMTKGIIDRCKQADFDYYIPMIDARRMEVFTSVYNKQQECVLEAQPVILKEDFGKVYSDGKSIVFGNGAQKASTLLNGAKISFYEGFSSQIEDFNHLCWSKFSNESYENSATYSPTYLKGIYLNA